MYPLPFTQSKLTRNLEIIRDISFLMANFPRFYFKAYKRDHNKGKIERCLGDSHNSLRSHLQVAGEMCSCRPFVPPKNPYSRPLYYPQYSPR